MIDIFLKFSSDVVVHSTRVLKTMKILIAFLFFLLISVSAYDYQTCFNRTDCETNECCIVMLGSEQGACYHLGKKGEYCMTREAKNQDVYNYFCPCAGNIICGEYITGSLGKCG
ncbi:venom protein 164-like [Parasteatoda tepidariorum]|uniref:venom protein 164-like n=1 Tax=Parasteatoda tepidariorum TaxID=114398 RepID=UPI00077FDA3F|nr:venom protein 164-like [Parasteatoda tepidariorum]